MTHHLSPQEFVDAADGVLTAARLDHADGCEWCHAHLAALRQLTSDVELATAVPEPSPLFWDHFSQRVQAATRAQSPTPARAWWRSWRSLSLGGLLAAAVLLVAVQVRQVPELGLRPDDAGNAADSSSMLLAPSDAVAADDGWDLMVMMASSLSTDELHHLAAPMTGVSDTMSSDLTPAEQQELVRLIRREMGGAE